jgi:phosphatidylinositol-3-phosphatase
MSGAPDPSSADWPAQKTYPSWPASEAGDLGATEATPRDAASRSWRWADQALTPLRVRLLALFSMVATGIVIWGGLDNGGSSTLAAALAHRRTALTASTSGPGVGGPSSSLTGGAGATNQSAPVALSSGPVEPAESPGANASQPTSAPAPSAPSPATVPTPATVHTKAGNVTQPTSTVPSSGSTTGSSRTAGTKIKHVFVIVLASPGYDQTWGPASAAPYLATQLRSRGTLLSNYYAIAHLDLPNYIAMISGQGANADTQANCATFSEFPAGSTLGKNGQLPGAGCIYPLNVLTLADQLTSSRHQWRAYAEDLANGSPPVATCRHPTSGQPDPTQSGRPGDEYATRHNPFVYFHSLVDLSDCASDDLPLTQLPADLASTAKTPNYAFIAPNLCHDGSETVCANGEQGGLTSADAFLKQWVPLILNSPAYKKDGLLVITFGDAPANDTSGCCQGAASGGGSNSTGTPAAVPGGGRVGALLLSRYVTPGALNTTHYNPYSLLRTIEDLFGLNHLANANQTGVQTFGSDILKGVFPNEARAKRARAARASRILGDPADRFRLQGTHWPSAS